MGRLGGAKSSGGCITCKIRKVKCDESRPACHRCVRTGRKCDGYTAIQLRTMSTCSNRTQAQFQAFDYFVDQILPGLTRVVDTKFWNSFLLQASRANNVVWLATTSMSELIRHLQSGSANRQLALQWYTQSISELQMQIQHEMKWSVACSVTAIIYICIECLLENMDGVRTIYQQAMQQIGQARCEEVDSSITPLLRHITAAHGLRVSPKSVKTTFTFTTEAQEALYEITGEAYQFIDHVETERLSQPKHWQPRLDLIDQRDHFLAKLHTWHSATATVHDKAEHSSTWSCMHLAYCNYAIWTSSILATEMAFDAHLSGFEQMLAYAETAIAAMPSPLFSFETRVIPFLGFVATRCRHPHIRRRALQLLHTGPQIENTRTAASVIASARRIIAIEESGDTEGMFSDVPASLDLPVEGNRLVSAKIENRPTAGGQFEQVLRFGKWRQVQHGWTIKYEKAKVYDHHST